MGSHMDRYHEQFREDLRKSVGYDEMRLMDTRWLARNVDADAVNKCRIRTFGEQSRAVARMAARTGDADDMQKARETMDNGTIDARAFALEENLALTYFEHYGQNYEGGEIVDDPNYWVCPGCHLKHQMSWKALPDNCPRCGWLSPLGEMKRDGVLRH